MTKNLVFIDSRVACYQTLISTFDADTQSVLIDAEQDGVLQMQAALAGYRGLDSIQIVSHGSAGTLYLGSTTLTSANLASYATALTAIGASLTESGDLLLYGCNVGQGDAGQSFITKLAQMTGADVAASKDLTGSPGLGGNWVLESTIGGVKALVLSPIEFSGLLAANTAPIISLGEGSGTTDFGTPFDSGLSIALQADGRILVSGTNSNDFALVRYKQDGSLDPSFNNDGKVTADLRSVNERGNSIAIQMDGKIIVGGTDSENVKIARFNSDGSLD